MKMSRDFFVGPFVLLALGFQLKMALSLLPLAFFAISHQLRAIGSELGLAPPLQRVLSP